MASGFPGLQTVYQIIRWHYGDLGSDRNVIETFLLQEDAEFMLLHKGLPGDKICPVIVVQTGHTSYSSVGDTLPVKQCITTKERDVISGRQQRHREKLKASALEKLSQAEKEVLGLYPRCDHNRERTKKHSFCKTKEKSAIVWLAKHRGEELKKSGKVKKIGLLSKRNCSGLTARVLNEFPESASK